MRSIRVALVLFFAVLGLVSCSSDPAVAKKKFLERGNVYFDKGKYKEAAIMYGRALQKDKRYGPARYKLALVRWNQRDYSNAVQEFHRAIELLPKDSPDRWDSVTKVTEIYLLLAHQKTYMDEVDQNVKELLARDPRSFDGHRLRGDYNFVMASQSYQRSEREEGKKLLDAAIAEYRTANSIKAGDQGVLMQLAKALMFSQNFAESQQIFEQIIATHKNYVTAYESLYQLYMVQGKAADAERTLKSGFQANPKQIRFLTTLATFYATLNRRGDMLGTLQQIKAHSKDFPDAYLTVGNFYLRMGDADSALKEFSEGMLKDPARKAAYQKYKIDVLMRQGKRADAAEINAAILKDNPNDSDARSIDATLLLDRGDVNKALAELESVVTRTPDNPVARYNLGRAHAARGEWEQARQNFQKAIEIRPDYVLARLSLARLHVSRGNYEAALKGAQDILKVDKQNLEAHLIESAALMGQRKFDNSKEMLDTMLKTAPNSPDVYFQLGVVNLAQAKYKEAEQAFKRTYELNPANPRGLMGVVETNMAQNKTDQALDTLQKEAAKSPNRLDIQLALGNTEVRAGHYDQAISYFQTVLKGLDAGAKSVRGDVFLRIGETYRRKGDLGNAITNLQKARETLPENTVVLSTLALVLDNANRWPEAKQVYDVTIKMDPNSAVSLNNLAFLMAEHGGSGELDTALTMAQKAKTLLPNLSEVSDTLGWIYLKKSMTDDAIGIFKDLVAKVPNQSTYRYHLAMGYYQKGDKPKALKEAQDALKYSPTPYEEKSINELIQKTK